MAPLLQVDQLTVRFGDRLAVDRISFALEPGQTLGLVGESGSGKSATSLALLGLLGESAQVTGTIRFDGEILTPQAMRSLRGKSMAMVFQEPMTALNPVMPVGAQIAEAVQAHDRALSHAALKAKVLEAMRQVEIAEPERRYNDYPHQFSGGQRQRILTAMAVINRPRLLIADEPTTALDVTVQANILRLLAELRASYGLAMLFISHDLAVVAQLADRVAVMQRGVIVEEGPAAQVFEAPAHPYTRKLLSAAPTMQTDRTQPLARG